MFECHGGEERFIYLSTYKCIYITWYDFKIIILPAEYKCNIMLCMIYGIYVY